MSNLQILSNSIRTYENLYNLTDLHLASGGERKHQPSNFIRLDTTKELIAEIESETPNVHAVKTIRGTQGGTYVCEELVLSYAMWISPKFHLVVLRAFMAMHKQPQQLALPEPEKKFTFDFTEYELQELIWLWVGHKQMNTLLGDMIKPLEAIGSSYTATVIGHHTEYKRQYKASLSTIKRLITPFKQSNEIAWTRALNLITQ